MPKLSNIATAHRVNCIIWAIPLGLAIFYSSLFSVLTSVEADQESLFGYFVTLGVLAAVEIIGTFIFRRVFMRVSSGSISPEKALGRYRTTLIVSVAVLMSVNLYGIIILVEFGNRPYALIFFAASIIAIILVKPRKNVLENLVGR